MFALSLTSVLALSLLRFLTITFKQTWLCHRLQSLLNHSDVLVITLCGVRACRSLFVDVVVPSPKNLHLRANFPSPLLAAAILASNGLVVVLSTARACRSLIIDIVVHYLFNLHLRESLPLLFAIAIIASKHTYSCSGQNSCLVLRSMSALVRTS